MCKIYFTTRRNKNADPKRSSACEGIRRDKTQFPFVRLTITVRSVRPDQRIISDGSEPLAEITNSSSLQAVFSGPFRCSPQNS